MTGAGLLPSGPDGILRRIFAMRRVILIASALILLLALHAAPAAAQAMEGCGTSWLQTSLSFERVGENHYKRTGTSEAPVEIVCNDQKFYADEMEFFTDKHLITARGNVVFTQGGNRIGADHMEFDTETRTGVFYNASGSATLGDRVNRSMFGTQEPDALFYGETIEKLGPKKYRITHGGFTTCVQPSPRWEVTSTSATLNLDDYALLKNSLLKVKGVPVFDLPAMYYPINKEDRATGFLIPVYGASSYRGQTLSNAFFWAISRSQDATLNYDWFSKTGSGYGGEYRYIEGPGSAGNLRMYWTREHEATITGSGGTTTLPAKRSLNINGTMRQPLPYHFNARAQVSYFSDITVQQTAFTNINDLSRSNRGYSGAVSGQVKGLGILGNYSRNEVFYGENQSDVYGTTPEIQITRDAYRPTTALPIYLSGSFDYSNQVRESKVGSRSVDTSVPISEANGGVRIPLSSLSFLTVTSSAGVTHTFYGNSVRLGVRSDESISRQFGTFRTEVLGPVFTKIFNFSGDRRVQKMKHLIEPRADFSYMTRVTNYDLLPKIRSTDLQFGGTKQINYSLTNRLLVKEKKGNSSEVLNVVIRQSYYSDARASQYDFNYTTFNGRPPSKFSPISIAIRATPGTDLGGSVQLEYDHQNHVLQQMTYDADYRGEHFDARGGLSRRVSATKATVDNAINAAVSARAIRNKFGGGYTFNYDIFRGTLLQQRIQGYYNAQCCGFAVEYQAYNTPGYSVLSQAIPRDRRLFISVTLAGIGSFSPPLGAFGGMGMQAATIH